MGALSPIIPAKNPPAKSWAALAGGAGCAKAGRNQTFCSGNRAKRPPAFRTGSSVGRTRGVQTSSTRRRAGWLPRTSACETSARSPSLSGKCFCLTGRICFDERPAKLLQPLLYYKKGGLVQPALLHTIARAPPFWAPKTRTAFFIAWNGRHLKAPPCRSMCLRGSRSKTGKRAAGSR